MSDGEVFPVPEAWAEKAHMNAAAYEAALKANGIAYDSTTGQILITGKRWSRVYVVEPK